jgi:hypothetical protein
LLDGLDVSTVILEIVKDDNAVVNDEATSSSGNYSTVSNLNHISAK